MTPPGMSVSMSARKPPHWRHRNRLREVRVARGWSLHDVTQHLGISIWTLARYESGMRQVPGHLLPVLARVLEVPANELVFPGERFADAERHGGLRRGRRPRASSDPPAPPSEPSGLGG